MPIPIDTILLVSAVVLIVAIVAARIGTRVGLPSLLLFLGLGMAARSDSGFGIPFDDPYLAKALAFAALVVILAEGGLTTKWSDIRSSTALAAVLATVGVGVSVGLMTFFGYYVLNLDLRIAILLGAVTSPTDAAAVFSVLRRVPIPQRLRGALEAESGLNDAPTVLLVTLASAAAAGTDLNGGPLVLVGVIMVELVGGVAIGIGLGWVGVQILRRVALPSSGLYPLATLVWAVFAYSATASVHASGFAAVYACALMLGNARLPHRAATRSFVEGIGWIAQIGLFVMLGLLAFPKLVTKEEAVIAFAAGLFLTFVARPISVMASAVWFKIPARQQVFLSWAGLRGAVPIVLSTIPLADGIPEARFIFDVVLGVRDRLHLLAGADAAPGGPAARPDRRCDRPGCGGRSRAPWTRSRPTCCRSGSRRSRDSPASRSRELRLPRHTVVSLIIRDDRPFYPAPRERIKVGDELLIVTPASQRENTEERLRVLGRGGRLARWRSTKPE